MSHIISNYSTIAFEGKFIESNVVETTVIFEPTITATADKKRAKTGDIVTYSVKIKNNSSVDINKIPFLDTINNKSKYIKNSFTCSGKNVFVETYKDRILYLISKIKAFDFVKIEFQVEVVK